MTLVGVGLLPDDDLAQRVVEFGARWSREIGEPRPGRTTNLPHVTLHQIPVARTSDLVDALDVLRHRGRSDRGFGSSIMGRLVYQPVGWLFADVARQSWMDALQRVLVGLVEPIVDRSALKTPDRLTGYSDAERTSYLRHGYRYIGESFLPHITLGRTAAVDDRSALSVACRADFDALIGGRTARFDRLVAYRAGRHGILVEILAEL